MKKIISTTLALLLLISSVGAIAADTRIIEPRASDYLDGAYISLNAKGNRHMTLSYAVYGTKQMDKIGVTKIVIEEFDGTEWHPYTTFSAAYTYNDDTHATSVSFDGQPECEYRATLYTYAKNSSGSDSRAYTGTSTTCKR